MRSLIVVALALGAAAPACGTRYVDLAVPPAGDAASSTPEPSTASGGSSAMPSPDSGAADVADNTCKVMPLMDTRCLICPTAMGTTNMICLQCQAPVKTGTGGDYCRTCSWSDLMGQCLQCFAADGTPTLDDCDALRAKATGGM